MDFQIPPARKKKKVNGASKRIEKLIQQARNTAKEKRATELMLKEQKKKKDRIASEEENRTDDQLEAQLMKEIERKENKKQSRKRTTVAQRRKKPTYPRDPVGYKPSLKAILKERAELHKTMNLKRVSATLEYRVKQKHTRFIPCSHAGNPEFYETDAPEGQCCLWCTFQIPAAPLPMPVKFVKSLEVFLVRGQYCSISCILADMKSDARVTKSLVMMMARNVYGYEMKGVESVRRVKPAPPRSALKKFGGVMDIDEFRAIGELGISTEEITLPFIPMDAGLVEIEHADCVINETLDNGRVESFSLPTGGYQGFSSSTPIENPVVISMQKGPYATAPSIREQLAASNRRMRLQQNPEKAKKRKARTIMSFMQSEEKF